MFMHLNLYVIAVIHIFNLTFYLSRLGKTLQSITLLYTLLCQGLDDKPMVKRAVIVTPTSLVSNWESEISKWLKGKVQLLALCESTRADVLSGIESFLKPLSRLQVFFCLHIILLVVTMLYLLKMEH
jgi:SNF2 family DNA or RNA helicase